MFFAFSLLSWVFSRPVSAHHDVYHNFAGMPLVFFTLVLLAALYFYERQGDTALGRSVLLSVLLAVSFVELFYGNGLFFGAGFIEGPYSQPRAFEAVDYVLVAFAALLPFAFFYFIKPRLASIASRSSGQ